MTDRYRASRQASPDHLVPRRGALLAILFLAALTTGCGGEDNRGPLELGDRWLIHDGEPALEMDEGATDAVREHTNEQKDPEGRVAAFEYDYSSKNTGEHYRGKVFNIRRDAAGRVVHFDVTINGASGFVRAQ